VEPALGPIALGERVDAWIAGALERAAPLDFRDIRKGVQSLSGLYVEDRGRGALASRAVSGPARRAALASYYAPLHFLTTHLAVGELAADTLGTPSQIVDLGCGTGAAGAASACALGGGARLTGLDRSGWALGEARRTWTAFGLRGRTRRTRLPAGLPRLGTGQLVVMGWMVNELERDERESLLGEIERGIERGSRLLVLEPLSGRVSPWWEAVAERLAGRGIGSHQLRARRPLPEFVARMDRAAGLDHRELGARVLAGPAA
jgi:SAM-dependent methyltransferase